MELVNIEDYITLYEKGISLDKIKPLHNQTYKIFRISNAGVRLLKAKDTYNKPLAYDKIKHFVNENEYFYMIPITTPNKSIVGFLLRGLFGHSYNTVTKSFTTNVARVPVMYGFDETFYKYDSLNECYPIIICEGCKDCLTLKKIYPYVLANNTSRMGINSSILRNISNKFLLAYDNDQAGQEGMSRDKKILRGTNSYVDSIKIPEPYKDCTDCAINKDGTLNKEGFGKLRKQVLKKLTQLYNIR